MRPVLNIAKLDEFGKSPYCPDELRGKDVKEIYLALEEGTEARCAYDAFATLRWMRAMTKRKEAAKGSAGLARSVTDRLKMQREYEALQSLRQDLSKNVVAKDAVATGDQKNYARLFAHKVVESEWTPVELELRKMFLAEVEIENARGGCSGCTKSNLVRKYIDKARMLASGK